MTSRLISLFLLTTPLVQSIDYYWRDYYGIIPEDALSVGRNINGENTYVGQVYVHDYGLFVAHILPGEKEISFPCHGVKKATSDIKILCTQFPENFYWLRTNRTSFYVDTIDKHVVVGGRSHVKNTTATLNIGRVMHDGILKIGSTPNRKGGVFLYYASKNKQEVATLYEVLIYSSIPDIDIKYKYNNDKNIIQ